MITTFKQYRADRRLANAAADDVSTASSIATPMRPRVLFERLNKKRQNRLGLKIKDQPLKSNKNGSERGSIRDAGAPKRRPHQMQCKRSMSYRDEISNFFNNEQLHDEEEDDESDNCCTFSANIIKRFGNRKPAHRNAYTAVSCSTRLGFTAHDMHGLAEDMTFDYAGLLAEQLEYGEDITDARLCAADHIVSEFLSLQDFFFNNTKSTTSAEQAERILLLQIVFKTMQTLLYTQISMVYMNLDLVTPKQAAKAVCWIDNFLDLLEERVPDLCVLSVWKEDMDLLVSQYLDKAVRKGMKEFLNRAWVMQSPDDVRENPPTGHLITGLPEQVCFMYSQQLSVAQGRLPEQFLEYVVGSCNEELGLLVCDMQLKIGSEWKTIPACQFCAMINDANRLADRIEELNEEYLEHAKLQQAGQSLVRDLAELALHATNFMCQRIMFDLCAPESKILTSVGNRAWEMDNGNVAVARTIATFKDYFADLEVWLVSEYYLLRVIKSCFELTIQAYVESFFGNTIVDGIKNSASTSAELLQDHRRLALFFNGPAFDSYHGKGGFYTKPQITTELQVIKNMSRIVSPDCQPDHSHEDIAAILQRFSAAPGKGSSAVLHLLGLSNKKRGAMESVLWIKAIAMARKDMATRLILKRGRSNEENNQQQRQPKTAIHLPDLRNSRFIHNIRPFRGPGYQQRLQRNIPADTMPHAESTLQLLEPQLPYLFPRSGGGGGAAPHSHAACNEQSAKDDATTDTSSVGLLV